MKKLIAKSTISQLLVMRVRRECAILIRRTKRSNSQIDLSAKLGNRSYRTSGIFDRGSAQKVAQYRLSIFHI